MCGIFGIIGGEKTNKHVLLEAMKIMKHRGPDASDFWISDDGKIGFSQTRLSIVDLDKRANQPMFLDKGNLVLIFNGEIYNYLELKRNLEKKYKFQTTSDTEVLGYLYKEYGIDLLSKIEGMFAFAIYDKEKGHVFIGRDFVGQKPLVYFSDKTGFYFASEIPALLNSNNKLKDEIDLDAIRLFLTSNFFHIPAPFTAFKNIKKLEPSHYLLVKDGRIIEHKRYYRLEKKRIDKSKSEDEFILDKIDDMKPKDVQFSSFLSGGNDTAFVCVGLRKNNDTSIDVYTLKLSDDDDDYLRSRYVCNALNLNQTVITFNPDLILNSAENQIKILGEPYFHITSVYADLILKEVKKRHKVIFTGAGGDEVYFGYDNLLFLCVDFILKINKIIPSYLLRLIFPKKYSYLAEADLDDIKEKQYMHNFREIEKIFSSSDTSIFSYFQEINRQLHQQVEIRNYMDLSYMCGLFVENLHSLTIQSDLVGMKNSVEIRCPFLEKQIIERGFSLGFFDKVSLFRLREGKKIIKSALLKYFDKKFINKKKIGFGSQYNYENILNLYEKQINDKIIRLSKRKEFNNKEMIKMIDLKKNDFNLLMKLYALELWFENFID